jgi:hypothetical protein
MSFWNYIVLFLSLPLLVVLVLWEIRRANRARLSGRLLATVLLVVSLAAIALPITYTSSRTEKEKEGVLLTEGYDPDSARFYLSSGSEVKITDDIRLPVLHILGYGLKENERAVIPEIPVLFHPSPMQTGIGSLQWTERVFPGEPYRIQGSFYNGTSNPVKLLLVGIGSALDSAELGSKRSSFELKTVPLEVGRAIYKLVAVSGKDTIEQESVPVEVLTPEPLSILMLAASPDFENKFLAGWLSERKHKVIVRTAISRDKHDRAYLNTSAMPVDQLSPSLLDNFDIVIADAAELRNMGPAGHSCLWNAIAGKGLGLVIKGDSMSVPGEKPMVLDSLHHPLVSESMHGSGKIVLTDLHTTYARLLSGERKEYASLWTYILQQAGKKKEIEEHWSFSPELPESDHPVRVRLQTAAPMPQGRLHGSDDENGSPVDAYLEQDRFLSFIWSGVYWPRESGWQCAIAPLKGEGWWYVWKEGDWKNIHRRERLEGTKEWIDERKAVKRRTGDEGKGQAAGGRNAKNILIAKGWFYLLFVLSGLFLWVERRI